MEWLNPQYNWTVILVPLIVGLFLLAAWRRRQLADRFGEKRTIARLASGISQRRRRWKVALRIVGLSLLVLALIGPRFGTRMKEATREGIDLVIALDVSASMMAEDVAPNRLERARNEIKNLLGDMDGDRIALVTFAGDAFIQCPLTTDYGALRLFLDVADPSLIPTPGTDFGAALEMALQAFKAPTGTPDSDGRTRAVLFVSDGENHITNLESMLSKAREEGVVIFAAGVGETEGAPIPVYRNGRQIDYKKDRTGAVVTTRLEEETLQDLARDGSYFRVARTSSSLPRITAALDQLDQTTFGQEEFEEYEERYQWPLALGLILLLSEWMLPERRRKQEADSWSPEIART
ncbi:MAG: VWA domain-containing protein [Bacteroidota bacterium]|nr:VWA domain-containing protein [Bacteroidota bacterium]